MGKLTVEQKAYLASIDSKKKRKKQKKEFKLENLLLSCLFSPETAFKCFDFISKKNDENYKKGLDIIYKEHKKTFELTPDELREITEPKKNILDYDSINLDTFNGTLGEYISVLIKNIPNDMDLGSEIRRIFK